MRIRFGWILLVMLAVATASGAQSRVPADLWDQLSANGPANGPADAPVTIVEFGDFECPHCGGLFPTLQTIRKNYGNQVRLVFRQFPSARIHPHSRKAAEASLCAHDQKRFWEYHDSLFGNQEDLAVDALKRRAVELGLDTATFNSCLDSGKKAAVVDDDMDAGEEAGVFTTPTMIINGRVLEGNHPYAMIERVIKFELNRR